MRLADCLIQEVRNYTVGWSENHFFKVSVSKAALRYQNNVYEILARSVRCEDPRKIVEVLYEVGTEKCTDFKPLCEFDV